MFFNSLLFQENEGPVASTAVASCSHSVILKASQQLQAFSLLWKCYLLSITVLLLQLGGLSDLMCVCVSSCHSDLSGGLQREDWKLLQTWRMCVSIKKKKKSINIGVDLQYVVVGFSALFHFPVLLFK